MKFPNILLDLGLQKHNITDYVLKSIGDANNPEELTVFFSESKMIQEGSASDPILVASTQLNTVKIGSNNGLLYTSHPMEIMSTEADKILSSFDAHMNSSEEFKALATVADNKGNAVIREYTGQFSDSIRCLSIKEPATIQSFDRIPITFMIKNEGFRPITTINIKIGAEESVNPVSLYPGDVATVTGYLAITPSTASEFDYTITASYDGGKSSVLNGTYDIMSVELGVNVKSELVEEKKTTYLLEVTNQSLFPLTADHIVTVGLYLDPLGEEP